MRCFANVVFVAAALWAMAGVGLSLPAHAEFETKAEQAILIDMTANAILYEKNADALMSPASMSKLMTLAVVFKLVKEGKLDLEEPFVVSENAWRTGGAPSRTSAMMVPVNTSEPLKALIRGIIVQSGNDAAIAIAEGLSGSEAEFARVMTEEAKRIGLRNSTFRNATGLYHPEHLTTARDLARLTRYLIETYSDFYPWFAETDFRYRRHRFRNRNPLLGLDIGVDGLKTGYLSQSGFGIVASAQRDGRRLIAVINGLPDRRSRRSEGARLIKWGFTGFSRFKLFTSGDVVGQARVWGGSQLFVPLRGEGDLTVVLPRFPVNQRLRGEIVYNGPLKPPVMAGSEVAKLRVTSSAGAVNEVPLFAAETVEMGGVVRRGLDSAFHLAFGWLP